MESYSKSLSVNYHFEYYKEQEWVKSGIIFYGSFIWLKNIKKIVAVSDSGSVIIDFEVFLKYQNLEPDFLFQKTKLVVIKQQKEIV